MPIPDLRHSDIAAQVPPRVFDDGADCQREGRVIDVECPANGNARAVIGRVRERDGCIHSVYAALASGSGGQVTIEGDCSCPVGFNCEHVVAVLLAGLEAQRLSSDPCVPQGTGTDPGSQRPARARAPAGAARGDVPLRQDAAAQEEPNRLLYLLELRDQGGGVSRPVVTTVSCRVLDSGSYAKAIPFSIDRIWQPYPPRFVRPRDVEILRLAGPVTGVRTAPLSLVGEPGARMLEEMLASGRCHWLEPAGPALAVGPPREGDFVWRLDDDGLLRLVLEARPAIHLALPVAPPWYLDLDTGVCGPLQLGLDPEAAATLAAMPPLDPAHGAGPPASLCSQLATLGLPGPPQVAIEDVYGPPLPCLRLQPGTPSTSRRELPPRAALCFDYEGDGQAAEGPEGTSSVVLLRRGDGLRRIHRDRDAEAQAYRALIDCGLAPMPQLTGDAGPEPAAGRACLVMPGMQAPDQPPREWLAFVRREVPRLREAGWRIEIDESFEHRLALPEAWYANVGESDDASWFDLDLGVIVDGRRVPLLPVLHSAFSNLELDVIDMHEQVLAGGEEEVFLPTPELGWLVLPRARVHAILLALLELLDPQQRLSGDKLRLPARRAGDLEQLRDEDAWRWQASEPMEELTRRISGFRRVRPRSAPRGFRARLRPYQRRGLGWLQFLREFGFGGVLADDMGLGKTVQTLAHLATEKRSGQADRPSLVVAPTSLLANWAHEARCFAPGLRVLTLHGPGRVKRFEAIPKHDLVITSYALVRLDQDALAAHDFHLLVLDEAQALKNPRAQVRQAVQRLCVRQRLCLTGTPVENHLGELWSLFDLVEPGLLGSERQFRHLFRTPIEKHGNSLRPAVLERRLAPFLLRRTKEQVTPELPDKVEIGRLVELQRDQRDLYETIRLSMHARVREALARQGLERSHVLVLDALLKLRQVCCDPRLVKLEAAQGVRESAKLELLMTMLPEMVEQGRRILVFSQFTSMLALIEPVLEAAGIRHRTLTGRTRDRDAEVQAFQQGEAPVFLLSLKAGGTGLNLTAADTVIHYDPWWNPAVEAQATDRAHRIGQDKKVFVYRLVTAGTVEEKMQALKERKQQLSDTVLARRGAGESATLSREDLEYLMEPLA